MSFNFTEHQVVLLMKTRTGSSDTFGRRPVLLSWNSSSFVNAVQTDKCLCS